MNKNELIEQLSSSELSDKQLSAIQNIVNSSELGGVEKATVINSPR